VFVAVGIVWKRSVKESEVFIPTMPPTDAFALVTSAVLSALVAPAKVRAPATKAGPEPESELYAEHRFALV
jgi:hypothetical protein